MSGLPCREKPKEVLPWTSEGSQELFFAAVLVFGMGFLAPKAWGQVRVSIAQAQDLLTFAP